jgi:hypothetical protein
MRAALQVHAFARGIVGDHHPHNRVAVERGNCCPASLARYSAMNHDDRRRFANPRRDILRQVVEGVPRFGEDDDLPPEPGGGVEHDRLVQDRLQLAPFGVPAGQLQAQCALL